jgi:hypothetical protein
MSRWFGLTFFFSVSLFGCKKEVPPEAGGAAGGSVEAPTQGSAIDPR